MKKDHEISIMKKDNDKDLTENSRFKNEMVSMNKYQTKIVQNESFLLKDKRITKKYIFSYLCSMTPVLEFKNW